MNSNVLPFICTLTEVDECESQPCQNGGDCTDKLGLFECNCTAGYEGVQCETGWFSQLFFFFFQILSSKEMGGTTVSFFYRAVILFKQNVIIF